MANSRNKEFTALEKVWYAKLKASGFKDIEDTSWESPSHRLLREWHGSLFSRKEKMLEREYREGYQAQIETLLHHENFREICALVTKARGHGTHAKRVYEDDAAKIWELHAEGKTELEIGQILKIPRSTVHGVLVRFTKWMIML